MFKPINFYVTYTSLVALALVTGLALSEEQKVITRDAISFTVPNPFGDVPIFETNDSNGRYIGLHLP